MDGAPFGRASTLPTVGRSKQKLYFKTNPASETSCKNNNGKLVPADTKSNIHWLFWSLPTT